MKNEFQNLALQWFRRGEHCSPATTIVGAINDFGRAITDRPYRGLRLLFRFSLQWFWAGDRRAITDFGRETGGRSLILDGRSLIAPTGVYGCASAVRFVNPIAGVYGEAAIAPLLAPKRP